MNNPNILAYNLARLRRDKLKKTQLELAADLGIKRSTYAKYEIDTQPPDALLNKIIEKYKIPPEELTKPLPPYYQDNNKDKQDIVSDYPETYNTTTFKTITIRSPDGSAIEYIELNAVMDEFKKLNDKLDLLLSRK